MEWSTSLLLKYTTVSSQTRRVRHSAMWQVPPSGCLMIWKVPHQMATLCSWVQSPSTWLCNLVFIEGMYILYVRGYSFILHYGVQSLLKADFAVLDFFSSPSPPPPPLFLNARIYRHFLGASIGSYFSVCSVNSPQPQWLSGIVLFVKCQ